MSIIVNKPADELIWPDDFVNKIICGDCLEVMKKIPDGAVDLVVTSPPYNANKDYGGHDDNMDNSDWFIWLSNLTKLVAQKLLPGGYVALNGPSLLGNPRRYMGDYLCAIIRKSLNLRDMIVWIKGPTILSGVVGPTWGSPGSPYMRYTWEPIIIGQKNGEKEKLNELLLEDLPKLTINPWVIQATLPARDYHPATFPIKLPSRLITLYSKKGDNILDPFLGSGTTAVAAKQLGRKFIGIEISMDYCKIAEQRLAQEELFS